RRTHLLDGPGLEQISTKDVDPPALNLQVLLRLVQVVRIAADEHQVGAGFGECLGHGPAQPPTGAADQRPAAADAKLVEDVHVRSPPSRYSDAVHRIPVRPGQKVKTALASGTSFRRINREG